MLADFYVNNTNTNNNVIIIIILIISRFVYNTKPNIRRKMILVTGVRTSNIKQLVNLLFYKFYWHHSLLKLVLNVLFNSKNTHLATNLLEALTFPQCVSEMTRSYLVLP